MAQRFPDVEEVFGREAQGSVSPPGQFPDPEHVLRDFSAPEQPTLGQRLAEGVSTVGQGITRIGAAMPGAVEAVTGGLLKTSTMADDLRSMGPKVHARPTGGGEAELLATPPAGQRTTEPGVFGRILSGLGLLDLGKAKERTKAAVGAEAVVQLGAREAGVPTSEYRQPSPRLVGQALTGVSEAVSLSLGGLIASEAGLPKQPPETVGESIAYGAGHVAGFVTTPLAAGRAMAEASMWRYLSPLMTDQVRTIMGHAIIKEAAVLAGASVASETGHAFEQEAVLDAGKVLLKAAAKGAATGAVFGGARWQFPGNDLPNRAARLALGLTLNEAVNLQHPFDDRPLAQKVFDTGLGILFLFNGRDGRLALEGIRREAKEKGLPLDDALRMAIFEARQKVEAAEFGRLVSTFRRRGQSQAEAEQSAGQAILQREAGRVAYAESQKRDDQAAAGPATAQERPGEGQPEAPARPREAVVAPGEVARPTGEEVVPGATGRPPAAAGRGLPSVDEVFGRTPGLSMPTEPGDAVRQAEATLGVGATPARVEAEVNRIMGVPAETPIPAEAPGATAAVGETVPEAPAPLTAQAPPAESPPAGRPSVEPGEATVPREMVFEKTAVGPQGVIEGTPSRAMPTTAIRRGDRGVADLPLVEASRETGRQADLPAGEELDPQRAAVQEWLTDQLGSGPAMWLATAKSAQLMPKALRAKLQSLGIDPKDAWDVTHAAVPKASSIDRLVAKSMGAEPKALPSAGTQIIREIPGPEGTAAVIAKIDKGYSVTVKDVDSGSYVGQSHIYPTLEAALKKAQEIAPKPEKMFPGGVAQDYTSVNTRDPLEVDQFIRGVGGLNPKTHGEELKDAPLYLKNTAAEQTIDTLARDIAEAQGRDQYEVANELLDSLRALAGKKAEAATKPWNQPEPPKGMSVSPAEWQAMGASERQGLWEFSDAMDRQAIPDMEAAFIGKAPELAIGDMVTEARTASTRPTDPMAASVYDTLHGFADAPDRADQVIDSYLAMAEKVTNDAAVRAMLKPEDRTAAALWESARKKVEDEITQGTDSRREPGVAGSVGEGRLAEDRSVAQATAPDVPLAARADAGQPASPTPDAGTAADGARGAGAEAAAPVRLGVMDSATAEHFSAWLNKEVAEADRYQVEQNIHLFLRDYPDLIEKGRTWSEIRDLASRYAEDRNVAAPSEGPGVKIVRTGPVKATDLDPALLADAKTALGQFGITGREATRRIAESLGRGRPDSAEALVKDVVSHPEFGGGNVIFTKAEADAAKARIRQKSGRLTAGIDPTLLKDYLQVGGYYLEAGVRDFGSWANRMAQDFGEAFRPSSHEVWLRLQRDRRVVPAPARVVGRIPDAIRTLLAPATRGAEARLEAGIIRENAARLALKTEQARHALRAAQKTFDTMPDADRLAFIDAVEVGGTQPSKALQPIAATLRELLDGRREQVQQLGIGALDNFIEDYFPHIWERPDEARTAFASIEGRRPLAGPASFLKQRTIPTTREGIERGLVPVSTNPVALTLLKLREMDRFIMGKTIFAEMKDKGLARFVRFGEQGPPGWIKIDDKIARVLQYSEEERGFVLRGDYYAPEPAAMVLHNYLRPGLHGNAIYDAFRGLGNTLNQAQLGFSAFHLGFVAMDAQVSQLGLGLQQLSRGQPVRAAKNLLLFPLAPVTTYLRGSRVLREALAPGTQGAEMAAAVDAMIQGGGRVRMDAFYHNNSLETFREALRSIRRGDAGARQYARSVFGAFPALLEAVSKPMMEVAVPRMKLGVFADLARHEIEKLEPTATHDETRAAMGRAWDAVDDRMGQLVYDNLFWRRAFKDGLMASVRSVGWNLGTFRTLRGGIPGAIAGGQLLGGEGILPGYALGTAATELPSQIGRMFRGEKPEVTPTLAYAMALPLLTALYGAIYQYLLTGTGPSEMLDYFYPKTGRLRPDGSEDRVSLAGYMKDVFAYGRQPATTVGHKVHPIFNAVTEMIGNEDFYGAAIRNEEDEMVDQAKDLTAFLLGQYESFSVRGFKQQMETGATAAQAAQGFIGITPAPAAVTRDAETQAAIEAKRARQPLRKKLRQDATRKSLYELFTGTND